jgi:hypothetical protein
MWFALEDDALRPSKHVAGLYKDDWVLYFIMVYELVSIYIYYCRLLHNVAIVRQQSCVSTPWLYRRCGTYPSVRFQYSFYRSAGFFEVRNADIHPLSLTITEQPTDLSLSTHQKRAFRSFPTPTSSVHSFDSSCLGRGWGWTSKLDYYSV